MKHMTFDKYRVFETKLAGRKLVVETGKVAGLANGSCMVRYGDTVVMVNATMAKAPRPGMDFFPLGVDYEEKMYSVGKIPGGWKKREGRASDNAILKSRLIDRPLRPLFPKGYRNDIQIVAQLFSYDQQNQPVSTQLHRPLPQSGGGGASAEHGGTGTVHPVPVAK